MGLSGLTPPLKGEVPPLGGVSSGFRRMGDEGDSFLNIQRLLGQPRHRRGDRAI
jgi:hypothetical protein